MQSSVGKPPAALNRIGSKATREDQKDESDDHFKSREPHTMHHLHSSSLLNNKNNSMAVDLCNTPSFDPGSKASDFLDSHHLSNGDINILSPLKDLGSLQRD